MTRILATSVLLTLFLFSGCTLFQSSQKAPDEPVIGRIGDDQITYDEFITQYNKSNPMLPDVEEEQGPEDFLPLYMDYRLKLAVAKDAGYMDDPDILDELEQYERQSAYPYWLERHIKDKLLDELHERSSELLHAQHLLISLPEDASPADTAQAYHQIMEARDQFLNEDVDFMELSDEYSSRQRGQSMGGDLGYFSAGWAVKPFEDAAYGLQAGEISKPVRTPFGYHLIHIKDRIEKGPDKHFSHVFFMTRGINEPVESVMRRANQAHDKLERGEDWADVVEEYSQDEESRLTGGTIGWVDYGMYEQSFTERLMQLDQTGEYSEPFNSQYGIHIARLDSVRHPTDEEIREELAERLQQLPRYRENEQAVLNNAAEIGNARFHTENRNALEEYLRASTDPVTEHSNVPESLLNKPVFTFNGTHYDGNTFMNWLSEEMGVEEANPYHHEMADRFRDYVIDSQLVSLTHDHFPEFSRLSEDYHTGLAVFQVNEDSIWTYARQDTARLRQIYQQEPEKFQFDQRYRYIRFSASADSLLDDVRRQIEAGVPVDSIRNEFSQVAIRQDVTQNIEEEPHSQLKGLQDGEFTPYFDYQRRRTSIYLDEILEPRQMEFEEAYNRLVSHYQPIREQEWIQSMREQYDVEVYHEVLESLQADQDDE